MLIKNIYDIIRRNENKYKRSKIISKLTRIGERKRLYKSLEQKEDKKEEEVWIDIKGYEGRYQVSNMGRIKRLERTFFDKSGHKQHLKERILDPCTDQSGYLLVKLSNNNRKQKTLKVHRLVCSAFHKNFENKLEVNHINEDKLDNRACNLEWVTRKENCKHGTRTARIAKTQSKSVGQYTRDGELIKVWQSTIEVQRQLGFDQGSISKAARGNLKTAYGYVWKYIEE